MATPIFKPLTATSPGQRGGQALPVPKKPKIKKTKAAPGSSYFPSTDVSAGDMARLMQSSRNQVNTAYKANPLPGLNTYQQPFIDAATREQKLGNDMLAAIGGASQYSQGLTSGLSDWIQQNVGVAQGQAAAAGSGVGAPTVAPYTSAAATAAPIQSYGTSQSQYLNSLAPYVAGSAQQYQADITKAQQKALQDYSTAQQSRASDVASAITDTYDKNLSALTTSRNNTAKNAIAEYIALTSAGMKAKDAAEKVRVDTANILKGQRSGDISQQNADANSSRAATDKYKALHPNKTSASTKPLTASQKLSQTTQARKDALKAYGTKVGTDSSVTGYDRQVTFSYIQPASGVLGAPKTAKVTIPLPSATQDPNDPSFQKAVARWIAANGSRYPQAKLIGSTTGTPQKTPGVTIHYGAGKGTNWQNALTAYATHFSPKAGETAQAFRSRMAKQLETFLPRPKA